MRFIRQEAWSLANEPGYAAVPDSRLALKVISYEL